MSGTNVAPVIIKRKKIVAGDGHHGGAWKVAYADFVTAMMAFFMLMWLLNATTEKQRKGIADYFNPTIPVNRISGGGEGSFGGESVFSEEILAHSGMGASAKHASEQRQAKGQTGLSEIGGADGDEAERAELEALERTLLARGGESMASDGLLQHIVTRVTDEGLIVEIFDTDNAHLFTPDTAQPTVQLVELMTLIADVFDLVSNDLAIGAHTRAHAKVLVDDPSWALSTRRAQATRSLIEAAGLSAERIQRVTGFADRKQVTQNPMAVRNNRVELILLRSDR